MHIFPLLIAKWYRQNQRSLPWRETKNPYFIWLSEIIMQQTRIETGLAYYEKFTRNYPTIEDLAFADEQQILNDWQGLGYYSRARNLHFSAQQIVKKNKGVFPNNYEDILKLKGVGKYTAAAISSFAYGEKKAVVDGNVYRLLSRVYDIATPIDSGAGQKEYQELADELIPDQNPDIHNQAIMDLGATICTPRSPNCENCPLVEMCEARKNNTIDSRPVKAKKQKVVDRYFHFLMIEENDTLYIEQRTSKGIWQNMYQFPLLENQKPEIINSIRNSQNHESEEIIHKLSHQTIHAVFHHLNSIPIEKKSTWIKIKRKDIQDYPLPRIIDRYLEFLAMNN